MATDPGREPSRPHCTCKPPSGVTRNHDNGCPLFDVDAAYRQGRAEAAAPAGPDLRETVEASMNDIGLGTDERMGRARERIRAWAEKFLNGLSFNEPALQKADWAKKRAPLIADSIIAALAGTESGLDRVRMLHAARNVERRNGRHFSFNRDLDDLFAEYARLGAAVPPGDEG